MPTIDAPITTVTVYPHQAQVKRAGTVALPAGESEVVLPNLPLALIDDSVRVSGRGAGVRILGVEVRTEYAADPTQPSVQALQHTLDDLRAEDRVLRDAEKALTARGRLFAGVRKHGAGAYGRGIAHRRATVDDLSRFADSMTQEHEAILTHLRDLHQQRQALARRIEAAEKRLHPHHDTRTVKAAYVTVEAAGAVDFALEAVYNVYHASWTPLYDVRLTDTEVELTYLAQVVQETGETWENVSLSLSTARPAASAALPELKPQYIGAPPAMPLYRAYAPASMAKRAEEGSFEFGAMADAAPQAEVMQTTVEESNAALTYRVAKPVTVASDYSPHKVTVTVQTLQVELDYLTVPKLAEEAYLRAKITNTSAFTLLPGGASIYHGDAFVGKTMLELVAPGEEFEVQLGVDDRIRVSRELMQREVGKRLIGSNRLTQISYRIKLNNLLPRAANITVIDQIPLSQNERVVVRLADANPQPAEQDKLNILTWTLRLEPGAAREITFGFTVEQPRDMTIVGL